MSNHFVCVLFNFFFVFTVRLSVYPLAPNPWDCTIKNLFSELRQSLIYHTGSYPTDTQLQQKNHHRVSQLFAQQPRSTISSDVPEGTGLTCYGERRYVRPTLYSTMQHFIISMMASITVAYIGTHSDESQLYKRSIHMASCIFISFGSLIAIMDGTSHEINPYLYTNSNQTKWFHSIYTNIVSRVLYSTMIVPITSMIVAA